MLHIRGPNLEFFSCLSSFNISTVFYTIEEDVLMVQE